MKTQHQFYFCTAGSMTHVSSESVALIVTSPPYPMVRMWDEMFARGRTEIADALANDRGAAAFELMHQALDPIWRECLRVLMPGGIACINIGDAVRTVNGDFRLYPNHARVLHRLSALGLSPLPAILWRKATNAPNKFMGSGMMPPGAYVTLEHEYILIFRKGGKRDFKSPEEKRMRRESAYFWEERNNWFSDVWTDLRGTVQKMTAPKTRHRSGAFPFELPYRLIHMLSVKGDVVLDPFLGTGTTTAAAMAAGRNSIGYEQDAALRDAILDRIRDIVPFANSRIQERLRRHRVFVREREAVQKPLKHRNIHYEFPVATRQEVDLLINPLETGRVLNDNTATIAYADHPEPPPDPPPDPPNDPIQMDLFDG